MFVSFIIGNIIYYTLGILLAFIFKDNRAFCKYIYTAFEDEANDIAFLDDEDLPLLYTTTHEGIIMIRDDLLK